MLIIFLGFYIMPVKFDACAAALEWLQSGMECVRLRRPSEYSCSADYDLEARYPHVQQVESRPRWYGLTTWIGICHLPSFFCL